LHTWGYSFNNQIRFEIHYNAKGWSITELDDVYIRKGIAIIKISEVDHDIVPTLDSDPFQAKKVLAWVNKIGGDRIHVLRDRMKQEDLYYIILHELGHIFGVMHTNKDELMQPTYMKSNSSCIDKNTAQKAALYLSIDPQSVNWCTSDE
jgi:hypothetical protein